MAELITAMACFLIVGGVAITLVRRQQSLYGNQQGQVALNMSLRNAVTMIQNDVENAGTGYYQGIDIPSWPVGVTVTNNAAGSTSCFNSTTFTYGPDCFDTLNIVGIDNSVPPAHPVNIPAANCTSETSSNLFIQPASSGTSLNTLASAFHNGDQILVVQFNAQGPNGSGVTMVTTNLTADGQITGSNVKLQHNPTGASGTDPFNINPPANNNKFMTQFCSPAWVLRLNVISYQVDATNPANPKLTRTSSSTGVTDIIAEQIIGFKIGAWNSHTDGYSYNASDIPANGGYDNDWTSVRSLRVSVIGRGPAAGDPTFHNNFDQGNYYVDGAVVVVDPRNLSMNH